MNYLLILLILNISRGKLIIKSYQKGDGIKRKVKQINEMEGVIKSLINIPIHIVILNSTYISLSTKQTNES